MIRAALRNAECLTPPRRGYVGQVCSSLVHADGCRRAEGDQMVVLHEGVFETDQRAGTAPPSPALRAATVAIKASFDAMGLCTRGGTPIAGNHHYDELSMYLGSRTIADLAAHAIAHAGQRIAAPLPHALQCHALELDVAEPMPIYVVAFRRDENHELALTYAAAREVQQNLRHALQLLDARVADTDVGNGPRTALTTKEEEVLGALMAGYRVPTIARDFHVSQSTVRSHLRSIFQKYGVHSQAALFEKLLATRRPA
jgi:DNA-binding CsgD family transcriptional regulator